MRIPAGNSDPKRNGSPSPSRRSSIQDTRRLAQAQLERNAKLSFRNNKKYSYLLRCLLSCESCGTGHVRGDLQGYRKAARAPLLPVSWQGSHPERPRTQVTQRPAKARELEEAVWKHVKGLMSDPERLLAQFEGFAHSASESEEEDAEAKKFEGHLKRLSRENTRLVDAYQAEIIELKELEERRTKVAQRRKALKAHYEQQAQLRRQGGPRHRGC